MDRPRDRTLRAAPPRAPERLGPLLFALGVASLGFDLASVLVKAPLGAMSITIGDGAEALGVFAMAGLYAAIARALLHAADHADGTRPTHERPVTLVLLFAVVLFALGRGIHLAANSISDALVRSAMRDPGGIAHLWDEVFGHIAVDVARIALAVGLTRVERMGSAGRAQTVSGRAFLGPANALIGSVAYGFIYFASAVEGQTAPLAIPFCLIYTAWSVGSRSEAGMVQRFFTAASVVSLLLFATWFLWQGGFPEFTRAGILRSASLQP